MQGLGIELEAERKKGNILLEQIDAAELSPGEFAHKVVKTVDTHRIKTVVIDSMNGYQAAMPEENSAAAAPCSSCAITASAWSYAGLSARA